jgi:hypothetical protein
MGWIQVQCNSRRLNVKSSTKSFVFGMVVGAVAYHVLMQSGKMPATAKK